MAYTETACYVRSVGYTAVAAWAATTAYTVGQIVRQLAAPASGNERCFICLVAGTSVGAEPAWVLTRGAATNETTVHWMECTGLPAVNGDSTNTNAWHASAGAIALGWIIKNVAGTSYFICTTAGTGGTGAEPTWNTTAGATTTDGSVTWTCIGAVSSFATAWAAPHARLQVPLNGAANWLLNAGINIFIGDDHTETCGNTSYNPAFGCSVLSIDHTATVPPASASLKAGATINQTGGGALSFPGAAGIAAYFYGLTLGPALTGAAVNLSVGGTSRTRFEKCTFSMNGALGVGTSSDGSIVETKDCTFTFYASGNWSSSTAIKLSADIIKFENPVFLSPGTNNSNVSLFQNTSSNVNTVIEGGDFSALAVTAGSGLFASNPAGYILLKDCVFNTLPLLRSGSTNLNYVIDVNRGDTGTAIYRNERWASSATETTNIVVVRTGGAVDGATAISHQVATATIADNKVGIFNAIPLAIWNAVTGGSRSATIYGIANDSRVPNNDEVWFDCEYLGSATSPKGSYARGGKANVLAAGSALTADTSVWSAPARVNSHAYVLGDAISLASNTGRVFFATTAGTSAGSEPSGYASAVDGGSVTDGGAVFRAGCRFSQTLILSSPQPQQPGYLYCYPKAGRPSVTFYLDPFIVLS
jgi:hypothetical protein